MEKGQSEAEWQRMLQNMLLWPVAVNLRNRAGYIYVGAITAIVRCVCWPNPHWHDVKIGSHESATRERHPNGTEGEGHRKKQGFVYNERDTRWFKGWFSSVNNVLFWMHW